MNTIKRILADPFGLFPRYDSIKKHLDGIDVAKILISAFAAFSSGVTLEQVGVWVTQNSTSFGVYGGLISSLVVLIVQAKRLYGQGVEETPAK